MFIERLFVLIAASIVGACSYAPPIDPDRSGADRAGTDRSSSGRTATVDCRAGCQGNKKGCQESLTKSARIDSIPGKFFDANTLRIVRQSNAADSPGLVRPPNWIIERVPPNASHPTSIIVSPIINTCEGNSPDTQGVTFYEWTADYF